MADVETDFNDYNLIHKKLHTLRLQFYSEDINSRKIKRSLTEMTSRESDFQRYLDKSRFCAGRRMSYDIPSIKEKLGNDVNDMEAEAVMMQRIVDNLTTTKTMQRRRTESDCLSFADRNSRARRSIASYSPVAPAQSEWGNRFDEIVAQIKGFNIKIAKDVDNMKIENCTSFDESELTPNHAEGLVPYPAEENLNNHTKIMNVNQGLVNKKDCGTTKSMTEKHCNRSDLKTLMRSVSFRKPDLATYNKSFTSLRRTDSNNDVWIVQNKHRKGQQIASPLSEPSKHLQTKGPGLSPWKRFSRFFSFRQQSKN